MKLQNMIVAILIDFKKISLYRMLNTGIIVKNNPQTDTQMLTSNSNMKAIKLISKSI